VKKFQTSFFVLAAHCFQYNSPPTPSEYVIAILGRHNLNNDNEAGSISSPVREIIIHPYWNAFNGKYDNDISVVILKDSVEFNLWIRPVCIPEQSDADVVGIGTVISWGQTEKFGPTHSSTPKQLELPVVRASYCYTRYPYLAFVSSEKNFCAGFENKGKGTCLGDSGSGLYFHDLSQSPWIVRGIVSGSLTDNDGQCDVNAFQLYTDVARFAEWIGKVIEKSKNGVLELDGKTGKSGTSKGKSLCKKIIFFTVILNAFFVLLVLKKCVNF
jgi:secreted trypsin-like serine protease